MLDRERMDLVAGAESTISGKIRALDRAGFKRADIARFLSRRYQHVRNVLEAEKQRAAGISNSLQGQRSDHQKDERDFVGALKDSGAAAQAIFRLNTNADGSLLIPAYVMGSVAIGAQEVVIGTAEGDRVTLRSAAASMRRAQELVESLLPGADSLADSLIADRRREVEKERIDG